MKLLVVIAAGLVFATFSSGCGVSLSDTSCQVVPKGGQDSRINVTGTNGGSACQSIASKLGAQAGGWKVQGTGDIPSGDARQMCTGTIGGASYTIWDHILFNATGYEACQLLGGTFTGESPSPS